MSALACGHQECNWIRGECVYCADVARAREEALEEAADVVLYGTIVKMVCHHAGGHEVEDIETWTRCHAAAAISALKEKQP